MHETYDAEVLKKRGGAPAIGPRLGIVGGGQLARMTAMAALELGCDVVVLERNPASPAATLATHSLVGDWNSLEPLLKLAAQVDVVTLENEFVDALHLQALEQRGHTVLPTARTIGLVQDKFIQKETLRSAGLPVPRLRDTPDRAALDNAIREFGFPLLLKARRNAYDGKGNATLRSATDIPVAWERLGGGTGNLLFAEEYCDFTAELAVIITRGRSGEVAIYPVVETVQRDHVCHVVRAPAPVAPAIAARAAEVALRTIEAVGAVGSFGVELFLLRSGGLVVNELAPRVHNSGHYTLNACLCSQFENHVRAVLDLPLGSPRLVTPAAAMVNLLGEGLGPGRPQGLSRALAVPGVSVHLYGKVMSGPGRKMGHVTSLADTLAAAEQAATKAAAAIRFGDPL
jgi:5-(carboxyamino)imidazole ribonucleotide synthase